MSCGDIPKILYLKLNYSSVPAIDMDNEDHEAGRKPRKFIAFTINGAIGFILPIVMFFCIAYGYAFPEPGCTDSLLNINMRWGLIFSIPILILINIQSYLLTRGTHSPGLRGMVLGLSVSMALMLIFTYAMADDTLLSCP